MTVVQKTATVKNDLPFNPEDAEKLLIPMFSPTEHC